MSLKKIVCLAFFLIFSPMLSASSVLELVGAQDSVHTYALDHWPQQDAECRKNEEREAFVYKDSVYKKLGC